MKLQLNAQNLASAKLLLFQGNLAFSTNRLALSTAQILSSCQFAIDAVLFRDLKLKIFLYDQEEGFHFVFIDLGISSF